ncbi:MAG: hypothetical protein OEX09_06560, partial [Candidatus Bathyarchaeota archaeon]|nr:hypothetical protein [Candidatus Bathyarchaeota archaeon]
PKALKFYMLGPHLTNTTLSIAVRRNLKHPSEPDLPLLPSEIWVSQWRYVPRIPNEPLSWNTLGKYWSAVTNELGQKVDLQIHIAALDGRGWLAGRVRTVNLVTGEVVEYHSWRGGEWHYDEWFRVMVGIKRDRVDGWIKWYYNDQLLSEVSGIPTIIGNDAKVWPYFSDYLTLYPETHPEQIHDIVTYMDDIVISDSYIPLDYGVLSSQG